MSTTSISTGSKAIKLSTRSMIIIGSVVAVAITVAVVMVMQNNNDSVSTTQAPINPSPRPPPAITTTAIHKTVIPTSFSSS